MRRYRDITMKSPVLVEILHTQGCGNWQAARHGVYRVAEELGVMVTLTDSIVETPEAAEALRFLGSPTVLVGGRDVQPEAAERTDYGLG
jgi:K+-transporting ATPase c subunit